MFNILKKAQKSRKCAEESIQRSEVAAEHYHEAIKNNANAHEALMEKLDRRQDPSRMRAHRTA